MKKLILIIVFSSVLMACKTADVFPPRNIPKPPVEFSSIDK